MTPEQLARSIVEDIDLYENLKIYLISENRTVVSHKAYQDLDEYFQEEPISYYQGILLGFAFFVVIRTGLPCFFIEFYYGRTFFW
jgi:hypothetical protein